MQSDNGDLLQRDRNQRDGAPLILPVRFWTDYLPDKDKPGQMKAIDRVEWVKKGDKSGARTSEKISRLMPRRHPATGETIEAIEWQVVKPYYEAWKAGQEMPETGTPLAAWPGADRALAEALKKINILTIEDFATAPSSAFNGIPIPDLPRRQRSAVAFLEAQQSTSKIEAELASRDDTIDRQANQIAEMQEQIAMLMAEREEKPARKAKAA